MQFYKGDVILPTFFTVLNNGIELLESIFTYTFTTSALSSLYQLLYTKDHRQEVKTVKDDLMQFSMMM